MKLLTQSEYERIMRVVQKVEKTPVNLVPQHKQYPIGAGSGTSTYIAMIMGHSSFRVYTVDIYSRLYNNSGGSNPVLVSSGEIGVVIQPIINVYLSNGEYYLAIRCGDHYELLADNIIRPYSE